MDDGRPLLSFSANWYLSAEVEPGLGPPRHGMARRSSKATRPWTSRSTSPSPPDEWAATSPGLTAHRPVNAVPYVCAAAPGIRTSTGELPQIIPVLHDAPRRDRDVVVGNPGHVRAPWRWPRRWRPRRRRAAGLTGAASTGPSIWPSSGHGTVRLVVVEVPRRRRRRTRQCPRRRGVGRRTRRVTPASSSRSSTGSARRTSSGVTVVLGDGGRREAAHARRRGAPPARPRGARGDPSGPRPLRDTRTRRRSSTTSSVPGCPKPARGCGRPWRCRHERGSPTPPCHPMVHRQDRTDQHPALRGESDLRTGRGLYDFSRQGRS